MMLNFVKDAFRQFLEILLWLNLILWAIVGAVTGYNGGILHSEDKVGAALGGVIIGILIGGICNIFVGGLIATIISIEEKLTKLLDKGVNIDTNVEKLINKEKSNAVQ